MYQTFKVNSPAAD